MAERKFVLLHGDIAELIPNVPLRNFLWRAP